MQSNIRSGLLAAVITGGLALSVTSAWAGTVGGSVPAILTLGQTDLASISFVGASGGTNTPIVTGTIDNNAVNGWKLTVASANSGILFLAGTSGAGREIVYTNVKFVKTGGTLGTGLTDPHNQVKNVATTGSVIFNTRSTIAHAHDAVTNHDAFSEFHLGVATTATVAYAYSLQITWTANTTVMSGDYTDSITLTLANDS